MTIRNGMEDNINYFELLDGPDTSSRVQRTYQGFIYSDPIESLTRIPSTKNVNIINSFGLVTTRAQTQRNGVVQNDESVSQQTITTSAPRVFPLEISWKNQNK